VDVSCTAMSISLIVFVIFLYGITAKRPFVPKTTPNPNPEEAIPLTSAASNEQEKGNLITNNGNGTNA